MNSIRLSHVVPHIPATLAQSTSRHDWAEKTSRCFPKGVVVEFVDTIARTVDSPGDARVNVQ